ncbi:MAG: pirin family protein [Nitrospirota bacterium]|nr:pirin family protein [Nitrospirota bacterium]
MGNTRKIVKTGKSTPTREGAGVHLRRAFGFNEVPELDPFLLLDDFRSQEPAHYLAGFPWHPHRGIETITYMLAGSVEHGDSMGNKGTIGPGDVQWMTAGSGIIHQEMPKGDEQGRMGGFQLWANLPSGSKMMDPRYREVKGSAIPTVAPSTGCTARIICGEINGIVGPVRDIVTDPEYLDISLEAGASFTHRTKRGHTLFAYVIEGTVNAGETPVASEHLVIFDREGREAVFSAGKGKARFLLISGKPLGEPVAWYGPIVMNTEEELELAFEEYRKGTFIKKS